MVTLEHFLNRPLLNLKNVNERIGLSLDPLKLITRLLIFFAIRSPTVIIQIDCKKFILSSKISMLSCFFFHLSRYPVCCVYWGCCEPAGQRSISEEPRFHSTVLVHFRLSRYLNSVRCLSGPRIQEKYRGKEIEVV